MCSSPSPCVRCRGFTLVELMVVVGIIGLLAAIAIPNFNRFQARSKQSEAKATLKSLFTAERSQFQEKDKYMVNVGYLAFTPERGNRYYYQLNAAPVSTETRAAVTKVSAITDEAITVDTFKYPTMLPTGGVASAFAPAYSTTGVAPAGIGVTGACPACNFLGQAMGNIDNDGTGIDHWLVSTLDFKATPNCGDPVEIQAPAGQPYNNYDDVNCP